MERQGCSELRVEYLHAPIALATATPRFSWIVDHVQHEYRIVVRERGGAIRWDSGRVIAPETFLITYDGEPIASNHDYRWTVESWDASGNVAIGNGEFGTSLLDPHDWIADWVEPSQDPTTVERWSLLDWIQGAGDDAAIEDRLHPPQLLRQLIDLPSPPVRARLFATAHGIYQASVNGAPAGDEVLAPGFDSYSHRISVQCYDVTSLLSEGSNTLGFVLADGWWAGRIGITGSSAQFGDRTSAIWQLHVECRDGSDHVFASGPDVLSSPGPWRYADLFIGEHFDARLTPQGWDTPSFDSSSWAPVKTLDASRAELVPFAGEPMRRVAEVAPGSVSPTEEGFIVDFGQVIAGRVRLQISGLPSGSRVTLEHSETTDRDGDWFHNIRGMNKEQCDVYIASGPSEVTYEPTFTYHGFRYVRVCGLDTLAPSDITAVVISSDLEYTGSFSSSDARLNRLHANVVWSQRGNFVSVPTDCPQREKVGWTGDAQVFAPAATNNAIVAPFLSRWLTNLRADQLDDGAVPITSPRSPFDAEAAASASGLGSIVCAAGWSDAIALVPWTLYQRCADVRVLEENYPAILRWVEFQRRQAESGLPPALEVLELSPEKQARQKLLWNTGEQFGDWLAPSTLEGRPQHEAIGIAPKLTAELVGPMFQARTLSIGAEIAAILGQAETSRCLLLRAEDVRTAFAAEYIDDAGWLPVQLQGVYALALAFDMVPANVRSATASRLAELVRERDGRLDTGFLSVPNLLDVLWDSGHRELAREILWQSDMPSWLYEVDSGATTIWESWDAIGVDGTPRAVSLNHYAFGCVDDWLYRRVAGIMPLAPGYRRVRFDPDLESGLSSARASVWTPFGTIAVEWELRATGAWVQCTVPHGVEAELRIDDEPIRLSTGTTQHHLKRLSTPTLGKQRHGEDSTIPALRL